MISLLRNKILIALLLIVIAFALVTIFIIFNNINSYVVIEGIVTDRGIGVSNASVKLKATSNPRFSIVVSTDENGKFKFKLEPNEFTEYVIKAGYNNDGQPYNNSLLIENRTQTINIELLPAISFYGLLYDSNGIPLHDCNMVFKTDEVYYFFDIVSFAPINNSGKPSLFIS